MALLPTEILDLVPSCARTCLSTYISQQLFPCSENSFACLCAQYSSQGYTLGELAYTCLELDCSTELQNSDQRNLYNICSGQTNAVTATHSTLTIPATSSTPTPTSKHHASTTVSSSTTTAFTSSLSPSSTSFTTLVTSSTTSLIVAAAPTASAKQSTLTSAQSVGVSVGAFGALIGIICAIYFIAWLRRRKVLQKIKEDEEFWDFIDKAPRYFPSDTRGSSNPFSSNTEDYFNEKKTVKHVKGGFKESKPRFQNEEAFRTMSQLLPELPRPNPPRVPPKHPGRVKSPPQTPATLFEEDRSPVVSTFALSSHPMPRPPMPPPQVHQKPFKLEKGPLFVDEYTFSPEEMRQPSLSIEIPRSSKRTRVPQAVPTPPPPPPPPPAPVICHAITTDQQRLSSKSQGSGVSLLNYYASAEAGSGSPEIEDTTPIEDITQKRRPVPKAILITKPTYPPRAVRNSGGSDTSFESNDPDEPTPPEEETKSLSPVAEHSPIATIRYPKVPRSSNQSVPRSPPTKMSPTMNRGYQGPRDSGRQVSSQSQSPRAVGLSPRKVTPPVLKTPDRKPADTLSLSGSTLAMKPSKNNRGELLEYKLRVDTSHSRGNGAQGQATDQDKKSPDGQRNGIAQESPLKGYGRVTNTGGRGGIRRKAVPKALDCGGLGTVTQEMILGSPLWEPKLTPSRRGEDLYLSVSVTTPR